jgi:hypothetical protein
VPTPKPTSVLSPTSTATRTSTQLISSVTPTAARTISTNTPPLVQPTISPPYLSTSTSGNPPTITPLSNAKILASASVKGTQVAYIPFQVMPGATSTPTAVPDPTPSAKQATPNYGLAAGAAGFGIVLVSAIFFLRRKKMASGN